MLYLSSFSTRPWAVPDIILFQSSDLDYSINSSYRIQCKTVSLFVCLFEVMPTKEKVFVRALYYISAKHNGHNISIQM